MKLKRFLIISLFVFLLLPLSVYSQSRLKIYFNAGYITNLKKGDAVTQADRGGSFRVGILNKGLFGNGRFGFYGGYAWFNEFHDNSAEYDDKGKLILAGIDFLALKRPKSNWYIKLGIGREYYYSVYRYEDRIEIEKGFAPDFGVLYNIKNFNAYLGWQPSDPHHINFGFGITFDSADYFKGSGY